MADKTVENQESARKLERKKQSLRDNLQRRKTKVKALKLNLDRQMEPRDTKLKPKDTN
jgi:hypothetical protein